MDVGLKVPLRRGPRDHLQRCKRSGMISETMLVRKNGSLVSQCTVSCVREGVLILGTRNEKEGRLESLARKVPASKMAIKGIFDQLLMFPLKGEESVSCWPGTGIKYPLKSSGQLLTVCRNGGKTLHTSMNKT